MKLGRKKKRHSVDILDIGAGGALLETAEKFKEKTSAELTVMNPVRVGQLPCKIVRVWPGEICRYGLAFTDLRERHRLALVRLLDMLMRQQEPAE